MFVIAKNGIAMYVFDVEPEFHNGTLVHPIKALDIRDDEVDVVNGLDGLEVPVHLLKLLVPQEIRMAQCRAQLIIDGKDDDVELLLASITDPIRQKLYRSYFEYEPIVKRDNAMINEMAPALGIDLDAFFISASTQR